MIGTVRDVATERKMRLLALSCCWRNEYLDVTRAVEPRRTSSGIDRRRLPSEVVHRRKAIAALEGRIEGTVDGSELQRALSDAAGDSYGASRDPSDTVGYAVYAASVCFECISRGEWEGVVAYSSQVPAYDALTRSSNPDLARIATLRNTPQTRPRPHHWSRDEELVAQLPEFVSALAQEQANQANVLRDIFGNPFRPATIFPEWRASTVHALAQQMYDSRDFSAMPILADALQDAGCDSEDVLNHCRVPGPHVRGCWVVDLVLGKA
jgi:hypothetical protein